MRKWLAALVLLPRIALAFELDDPRLPEPMPYDVFVPSGSDGRGLPAILLLHGHGGSERQWEKGGNARSTLERLIAEDAIAPHLMVTPGVGNSWYVTSEAYGAVDRAILNGLLPAIDAAYEVTDWAVIGLSMGGYGALRLGFTVPDRFKYVAALSPAIFVPGTEFADGQRKLFNKAFGDPFDAEKFEANNPFNIVPAMPPPVYLSVGDDDYFDLEVGTFAMFAALKDRGARPELRVRDGKHSWTLWRAELENVLREMAGSQRHERD